MCRLAILVQACFASLLLLTLGLGLQPAAFAAGPVPAPTSASMR